MKQRYCLYFYENEKIVGLCYGDLERQAFEGMDSPTFLCSLHKYRQLGVTSIPSRNNVHYSS